MSRIIGLGVLMMASVSPSFAEEEFRAELEQLNEAVRSSKSLDEQEAYIPQLLSLGDRAAAADVYEVAAVAFDYASRISRRRRIDDAKKYALRLREIRETQRAFAKVAEHLGKDDPGSRRKVAEFRAFVKGDWDSALANLAEGDDAIAVAAQLDRRHLGGEEAEEVADAWVTAAEKTTAHAAELYARAGELYDEAAAVVPTADMLEKMRKLGAKIGYATSAPAGAVRVRGSKVAFSPARLLNPSMGVDKAFDGAFDTPFYAEADSWLGVDLGTPKTITRISYAPVDGRKRAPAEWFERNRTRMVGATVQVSNRPDFKDAVTIHTITEPPPQLRLTVVEVSTPGVWRYVRYVPKPGDNCTISEFDVR